MRALIRGGGGHKTLIKPVNGTPKPRVISRYFHIPSTRSFIRNVFVRDETRRRHPNRRRRIVPRARPPALRPNQKPPTTTRSRRVRAPSRPLHEGGRRFVPSDRHVRPGGRGNSARASRRSRFPPRSDRPPTSFLIIINASVRCVCV